MRRGIAYFIYKQEWAYLRWFLKRHAEFCVKHGLEY